MAKSADAFRTISEVAEILQVPAHVLRFWESRFTQVKPVKRAGGRRYYRPDDIRLLSGIRKLLHDDGMTIKGVQKILREHGTAHVAGMAPTLSEMHAAVPEAGAPEPPPETPGAEVVSFDRRSRDDTDPAPADAAPDDSGPGPAPEQPETSDAHPQGTPEPEPAPPDAPPEPVARPDTIAPEREASEAALPPLPDLPDDPDDTDPAPPGALSALAGLHGPVPAELATRLSAIAARLRGRDTQGGTTAARNEGSNNATGD